MNDEMEGGGGLSIKNSLTQRSNRQVTKWVIGIPRNKVHILRCESGFAAFTPQYMCTFTAIPRKPTKSGRVDGFSELVFQKEPGFQVLELRLIPYEASVRSVGRCGQPVRGRSYGHRPALNADRRVPNSYLG